MTREKTDIKNLQEANQIRQSGFPTKIHASPYKKQIDEWIVKHRWSGKMIVKELHRLYPQHNHPSDRAIDNYRKKYASMEYIRSAKPTNYPDEVINDFVKKFDPVKEGVELWEQTKKALTKVTEFMDKTQVPTKIQNDLLRTAGMNFQVVCDRFAKSGLINEKPQFDENGEPTKDREYSAGEIKRRITEILTLKREIDDYEGRFGTVDTDNRHNENAEGPDEGKVQEKHSSNE